MMNSFRRFMSRAAIALAAFSFIPSFAVAQDNWAADDSSLEARKIERYKQLVDQSPEKSYAFNQLMATVGKGAAYQNLIAEYEKKANDNPKNFNIRMVLGHIYQYGGRTNEALAAYHKALEIKKTPLVYMAVGAAEAENRNFDPAVFAYESAAELNPNREQKQEIWRALAEIAIYRRDMERAKTCFAELIKLEPNSLFVRRELAQIYQQNRMFDEARSVLADAAKISSISANEKEQIELDIAGLYEEEGNDDEALKRYEALSAKLSSSHWMQRELNTRIIDIYRRKGSVEDLVKKFEKIWKSPTYQQHLELADLYDDIHDTDKAIEHLKAAINMSPKQADAHEKIIRFYKSHGMINEMYAAQQNLIKQIPTNPEYRFALYEDYKAQHQLDKSLSVLDEIQKKFPSDFDVLRRVAEEYMMSGRGQKAQAIYENWLKKHPNELDAYEALGDYYDADGQRAKAVATWQKIENISLDKSTKLETLARIYAEHNYTDEAEALYKKYVELNPKDCFILSEYAEILTTNGRQEQAIDAWDKLALTCTNDATLTTASRQLASLYESRGNQAKAIKRYRGLCESNPHFAPNFLLFAAVAQALNMPQEAVETLEARSLDESASAEVLKALNGLYAELGQIDKARDTLQKLASISEGDRRESLIEMAELDLKIGHIEDAQNSLEQALKLNSNDAETHEKLGDILILRRMYEEAVNNYETAFQIDDKNWQIALKTATTLSILGKTTDADEIYVKIVRESTDETLSHKAAQRAIDDHVWLGTLDKLSSELMPLLRSSQRKALYLEILLSVAEAQVQPYIVELKTRDAVHSTTARYKLRELADRYSTLLVESALYQDTSISSRAIGLSEWLTSAGLLNVLGQKIADAPITELGRLDQLKMMRAIAHAQLPGAVNIIKPFLGTQYSRALREHTLWALGLISSSDATNLLKDALSSALDTTRAIAIIGLGRQHAATAEIRNLLKNDPSNVVKDVAAWMLAAQHDELSYPAIRKLLMNRATKPHQIWALQQIENEDGAEALLESLWCGSAEGRQMAAQLMHSEPSSTSLATLTNIEAQGRFIRDASTQYLSNFDLDMLLDHFAEISMKDSHRSSPAVWLQANRQAFSEGVVNLSQRAECREQMLRDLITAENAPHLNIADISQRPVIIEAVRAIKPKLLGWTQSGATPESRTLASLSLRALALTQDSDVLEIASDIAKNSPDLSMQLDAIYAISLFQTPESRALIRNFASDKSYIVRAKAVSCLNPTDPADQVVLKKAAQDNYVLVAQTASELLEITLQ